VEDVQQHTEARLIVRGNVPEITVPGR
jgi:hypothetical protein